VLKRSGGVILMLVVTTVLALITGRELLLTVAYLLLALLLISLVVTWLNLRWVVVERRLRARRFQVGKTAEEEFTIINRGWLPKLWLEIIDHSTLPNHHAGRVTSSLAAGALRIWNVRTFCVQRGRFTLGPLTLQSGDPFGLFLLKRKLTEERSIVVYPATVDIPRFTLPYGELPGGDAMRRRTYHVTDNVAGVRDYTHGDSFNRIHWRSTARTGRLISKEFELDPTTDVWLYLDMDRGVHVAAPWLRDETARVGPALLWGDDARLRLAPSTEEYTATAGASLARHLLAQGRAVGMVAYGQTREVVQADRGQRQLMKLLETLAVLQAHGKLPFGQIITAEGERLARGTTVIAITPSAELDWVHSARDLGRRGVRVVAVVIEAHSFAPAPEQAAALAELRINHIPTYRIRRDDDLAAALSQGVSGAAAGHAETA
jgi:uncharacterized protein (DUF58 family)